MNWPRICNYVELQSKTVKPRKARACEWCAERIEKGEECHYRSFIFEDGPESGWSHPECYEAMKDADPSDLSEGWMPGDWKRGSAEPA